MRYSALASLFLIGTLGCNVAPEAINYDMDECAFCKMKISDVRFGAELVTKKGKIYKYDSAECLFNTYVESQDTNFAFLIVTDYSRPHTLIDAKSATFLISPQRQSPMGGNLSAYEHEPVAGKAKDELSGSSLTFAQLVSQYRSQNR